MKKLSEYISLLQQKPLHVRIRILWGTTLVLGILLIAVWGMTLKAELNSISGNQENNEPLKQTSSQYIFVERAESQDDTLTLYFRVNNPTNDILNFSKLEDIEFTVQGTTLKPSKFTDRQGQSFVQKILSHSENFGTLVFSLEEAADSSITFDDLYFESKPETIFKETLELDLEKLSQPQELRN